MTQRLSYFGPAGTYTEEAAHLYDAQAELIPFSTIPTVCQAVSDGAVDAGVVPIENSIEGSVVNTLDFLINESDLAIRYEIVLPIEHCLMVRPGADPAVLQVIFSHPQSLAQCRHYLEDHYPAARPTASLSNAAAVTEMLSSSAPAAAIGPQRAAHLYGAEIIDRGIQDRANNMTRFVVVAPTDHAPTGQDKTSICFSFAQDAPGSLYQALGVFALRDLNLVKIESRPTKESLGRYNFLVDCAGHRANPAVQEALNVLAGQVSTLKIFGSYPRWDTH